MFAKQLSISLALTALVAGANVSAQTVYVIQHAKVLTVSGPAIQDGSVVIKDGRIAEVGASVTVPPGATVIEARGLTVCPGLFDPDSNLGLGEATAETQLGQFLPHLSPTTSFVAGSEAIPIVRAAGVTHILLRMPRGIIPGQADLLNLAGRHGEDMLVQRGIAVVLAFPTVGEVQYTEDERFQVTPWSGLKAQYERRLKDLKDFFASARAYMKATGPARSAGARNQPFDAMIPVLERQKVVIIETQNHVDIRNAVQFARDEGLNYVIAAPVGAWRVADFLKANGVRVLIGSTQAYPDGEDDAYDSVYRTGAMLHEKGVPFAFSTLANRLALARMFPQLVGKAVAFGLPYDAALRAATLNAAEFLGVADKFGSIEKGKIANVVVVAGDIFDTQSSIKHVFINGEPVSLRTRETELYDQFKARPAPKKTVK
jgi:imidazolonepropionase-like amidohydrolase